MDSFPRVVVHLDLLAANAAMVNRLCGQHHLTVMAVTKGVTSDAAIVRAFIRSGISSIGDSRIHDFLRLRQEESGFLDLTLLRQPPRSQMPLVPGMADRVFISELSAARALGEVAAARQTVCRLMVVAEAGDRRDGVPAEELSSFVRAVSRFRGVALEGVAANVGCISGLLPTAGNQEEFGRLVQRVRRETGCPLPVVSTGGTVVLDLVERGLLSPVITELRCGEALLLGVSTTDARVIPWLQQETFLLEAEIIEVRDKPSAPAGPVGLDAEGRTPRWVDHGVRRRAVVALGYTDTDADALVPVEAGVTIAGSSSDHLVLDVTDAGHTFHEGDVVQFRMKYAALLHSMLSPYIARVYRSGEKEVEGTRR